jgi:predicted permease
MILSGLFQDLRGGARLLARSPGFTLIAVLSLAIGIGANTATFSFADGLLLRPLPVPDPDEVMTVGSINVATGGTNLLLASYPDYVDLRNATESFAGGLTAFEHAAVQLATDPDATPEIRTAALVSGNYFSAMGVSPALGRAFRSDEDEVPSRDAVAILSHGFWTRTFAARPDVLGRRVQINGIEFTVVGVAPESFIGLDLFVQPDFYVPLMMWPTLVGDQPSPLEQRDRRDLDVKGRLRDGVTLEQVGADVARIGAALAQEYPATNRGYEMRMRTELQNRFAEGQFFVAAIAMLGLLGTVILVVACVNVAGLLTSRAPAREGEIALRLSIGAGRVRIIRQLLTESLLLAFAGAAAGAAVGYLGILLWRQMPLDDELSVELVFQLDRRVLLATLAVAVASVLLFGLLPALRASRAGLSGVLRTTGGGMAARTGWGRGTLVVVQVALALVFIAITSFIYSSFLRQVEAGPGFRTEGVLAMSFNTELARLGAEDAQRFYERLVDRAREVAGVEAASLASFIPMSGSAGIGETAVAPEGYEFPAGIESETILTSYVDADFFGLMETPLAQGRGFATTDTAETPSVAVINQRVADRFWPGRSPVGQRFRANGAEGPWVEIVGVVPTGRYFAISEPPTSFMYRPYAQAPQTQMTLVVRSTGDELTLVDPLRTLVRELEPDLAGARVRTMTSLYYDSAIRNFMVFLYAIAAMGGMSMMLAFTGLYGLVASNVSQRTREIGIRMAIGADRSRVLKMVLGQALRVTLIGLGLGIVLTFGAEQALRAAFSGGNPGGERDVIEWLRVIAAMLVVTGLAAYLPARRAARIEPTRALRYE